MTDTLSTSEPVQSGAKAADWTVVTPQRAKRERAEKRFRLYGIVAIGIAVAFLVSMLLTIIIGGTGAFTTSKIGLDVTFNEEIIDPSGARDTATFRQVNYRPILTDALTDVFPGVTERREVRELYKMISSGAVYKIENMVTENPDLIGTTQRVWVTAGTDTNLYLAGKVDLDVPEELRQLSRVQTDRIDRLNELGLIKTAFNRTFFTNGDSREPEQAGILGALMGSFFSLLVCFVISFPLGVLTAVYLEEFAKKNRLTDFIEVNINNLAAVPSIVFGLLGLSIFLNVFNLPRSTPLVGGMVLALMTLPTIIIASRAALRAVPPSVREAAMGLGASKVQTTFHHTVPLAMPGMLTGTIIGMAQALGETAPLLMIGMVAFIVDVPTSVVDTATSLPVQIFLWADNPAVGFREMTSAAIMVLLVFLVLMNIAAVMLRKKLERRW